MQTLIRNGVFFDGSGSDPTRRDLLVADGVVATAEHAAAASLGLVDRVIEAKGQWVMPGFIDMHTHYDAEILAGPGLNESVRHVVTTVFMGSCSLSTILSSAEDCAAVVYGNESLEAQRVDWEAQMLERELATLTRP
ncbi:MAG: amidohydrolase family protein [Nannocystales bacterium]